MDELLAACADLFDKSPQPFGVAHVLRDENDQPYDFTYAYLNPSMAAMTHQQVEELLGVAVYRHWPGSDPTWVDYFSQAAYEDTAVEFESVSVVLDQFLNVVAFPIAPGYCGFLIYDVTDWMSRAQLTLQNADAGLFFYDRRTHIVLLTPGAKEQSGASRAYLDMKEFLGEVFESAVATKLYESIENFDAIDGRMLYEGEINDGRWLRLSLTHTGLTDRFAYGFLEDITRAKAAEDASERQRKVVASISRENYALHLVDLESDRIVPYYADRVRPSIFPHIDPNGMVYSEFIENYIRTYVAADDREMLAPALKRENVMRRLRQEGDFSQTFRRIFASGTEFVELRIFRLADSDTQAVFAARNINCEVFEQVRQREILEDALAMAKQANNAKSTFLTNMSHDLRTPMNSISGFAHLALDNLDDRDKVRNALEKIIVSGDHLVNLVGEILDFSRIESGTVEMKDDHIDLVAWGKSIESVFVGQAETSELAFSVDTSKILHPQVIADRLRLNQILTNTIGNAFKFTQRGGSVTVTVDELASAPTGYGVYRFQVKDTGVGMTPEFIERIFEPFERDGYARDAHIEGAGLGMTITKNLVDLFGGGIDIQSAPGAGSTFTIIVPLRQSQMEASDTELAEEELATQDRRSFPGKRALIVDDDELSREIVSELLQEHGFDVSEASDGDEAVEIIANSAVDEYDVVIMDLRMPRLSGDEATRQIRAMDRPDTSTLPIIATTADALEEGFRRSRDAGMSAHLTKPLNLRTLLDVLEAHL